MEGRALSEVDVDDVESVRPSRDSHRGKEHRGRERGILESLGEQRTCKRSGRQQRQGRHR